jgi:integrase
MFLRSDGMEWKKDHQRERMKDACKAAKIDKHIVFHCLRHTFASLLAMNGTRPELIQLQMGHSSARMTARYSHFSPSYTADTIRANKPSFPTHIKPGPVLVAKAG